MCCFFGLLFLFPIRPLLKACLTPPITDWFFAQTNPPRFEFGQKSPKGPSKSAKLSNLPRLEVICWVSKK